MNTFELHIPGKTIAFSGPSAWHELSDHQTVALMRLRRQVAAKPETLYVGLQLLYGLKRSQLRWLFDERFLRRKGLDELSRLEALELGQNLLATLTWIGQEDAEASFPKQFRLHDFKYGTLGVLLKRLVANTVYLAPQAGLGDCTFEEFMFADRAFGESRLPELAAILCRPEDPQKPGRRLPLDRAEVDARAALFAQLDPALLERIAFGFGCTKLLLQRAFPLVFPHSTESEPGTNPKKAKGNWLDVAVNMAKLDVTKVNQVERVNLYLALKVLNDQIRQAEEMEQKLETMRKK